MNPFFIYFVNILAISLPLSLFEIVVEKDAGWGSGWEKDRWHARAFAPHSPTVKAFVNLLNIEQPLNYHFYVFFGLLPLILGLEYWYWTDNFLLLLASFVGVLVFEDVFWFLFNWHFNSRKELLKGPHGSIWWHKRWVKVISNYYVPVSYVCALPLSLALLLLARYRGLF